MHKTDRYSVVMDPNEFPKMRTETDHNDIKDIHSGRLGHSSTILSRDESIHSRGSITSLFPNIKKSFDGSWSSGSVVGIYTPRIEKTQALFDIVLKTLNELYENYPRPPPTDKADEDKEYSEALFKIEDRISMIASFKIRYLALVKQRQEEFNKIDANIRSYLANKHQKKMLEIDDSEMYWALCRDLFVMESKLERCTGKLQFQIMELDFIGKINPLDQYELSIRINETSKFKTRIKIEKNGHQVWDSRNFALHPGIEDCLYVKFSELKPLNKSTVIIDKKVPFINNLIRSEPSIFMFWLSPIGSIKLKVIVQWNPVFTDPNLQTYLSGLDHKYLDNSLKSESSSSSIFQRPSASSKFANNRLSSNIESLFRSGLIEKNSRSNSMSNICEDVEEEKGSKTSFSKVSKLAESSDKSSALVKSSTSDAIASSGGATDTHKPVSMETIPCVVVTEEQQVPESPPVVELEPIALKPEKIDIVLVVDTESALPGPDDSCLGDNSVENVLNGDALGIESPVVGDSDPVAIPVTEHAVHGDALGIESPIVGDSDIEPVAVPGLEEARPEQVLSAPALAEMEGTRPEQVVSAPALAEPEVLSAPVLAEHNTMEILSADVPGDGDISAARLPTEEENSSEKCAFESSGGDDQNAAAPEEEPVSPCERARVLPPDVRQRLLMEIRAAAQSLEEEDPVGDEDLDQPNCIPRSPVSEAIGSRVSLSESAVGDTGPESAAGETANQSDEAVTALISSAPCPHGVATPSDDLPDSAYMA